MSVTDMLRASPDVICQTKGTNLNTAENAPRHAGSTMYVWAAYRSWKSPKSMLAKS
jgi:hypothetical protein